MTYRDMLTLLYSLVAVCIGFVLLLCWLVPANSQQAPENGGCLECNVTLWELRLLPQNVTISSGDMFVEAECQDLKSEIERQVDQPFTELVCVQVWAQRERS
jgi:hypothetical protein